jgi:SpoIID/LytB domain protein
VKRRRLVALALGSTLVAGLLAGGVASAPPASAYPNPQVELVGHGFGHGRGLGQYGALGYAVDKGWSYKDILARYYGNTSEGGLPGGDGGYGMSVRFMDRNGADTVVTGPLTVDQDPTAGQQSAVLIHRTGPDTWTAQYNSSSSCAGPWGPARAIAGAGSVTVRPAAGVQLTTCLSNGTRTVKGTLRADDVEGAQVTINDLAMGDYLKGVIPRESPASWGNLGGGRGMEALKAQAVAARSYSAAENRYPGVAKTCDTTACQVYNGASQTTNGSTVKEEPQTNTAVDATGGEVRMLNGAIARTEFSSSTGGYTAGGTFPAVPDDGDAVASNPNHTWTAKIGVDVVESKWPGRGTLQAVKVVERNGLGEDGGRVLRVRLEFSGGDVEVTGDAFRSALSLKSDWFTPVNVASFPYHVVARDGGVFSFGGAEFHGSLPGIGVRTPARDITEGPGGGYWILGEDGGVFSFDVPFYGSMGGQRLNSPVVGMQGTAARKGYWLVAGDGGIFTFGDAPFFGSTGNLRLNKPVVGMAPTASGQGYWMVATDGGIFTFGDAPFFGSTGDLRLNQPVFAMAPTPSGKGYWLVAKDGGIFTFGDATFQGSLPGKGVLETAVELLPSPSGFGYLIVTAQGHVYAFGDASSGGGPADVGAGPSPAVGAGRVQ